MVLMLAHLILLLSVGVVGSADGIGGRACSNLFADDSAARWRRLASPFDGVRVCVCVCGVGVCVCVCVAVVGMAV